MKERDRIGEGNRDADRRYRKGVRKTVEETSPSERAEEAREMTEDELEEAREAEDKGRSRAKGSRGGGPVVIAGRHQSARR